jgi:hypothetical protein
MRHFPEGRVLYETIKYTHRDFSLRELTEGRTSAFLNNIGDETTRVSQYLMLLYDRFGQNSFVVGPKVQDLFRRTSLAKVPPAMLVPPVTGFYVALPDCPWRIWGGARTRWHQLSGVYVGFSKSASRMYGGVPLDLERTVHFAMWGAANELSVGRTDDALLWYSMSLDAWGRDGSDLESFFQQQSVMLVNEHDADIWGGNDPLDPAHTNSPSVPQMGDVDEHRRTLVCVLRTVLNLCLYLNSDEPDLKVDDLNSEAEKRRGALSKKKSAGKRKKIERQLKNSPKTRIVYVGPLFETLERDSSRPGSKEAGQAHASPLEHAVRPHWQRYWVGSGDQRSEKWTLKGMYVRGSGTPDKTITKVRE